MNAKDEEWRIEARVDAWLKKAPPKRFLEFFEDGYPLSVMWGYIINTDWNIAIEGMIEIGRAIAAIWALIFVIVFYPIASLIFYFNAVVSMRKLRGQITRIRRLDKIQKGE